MSTLSMHPLLRWGAAAHLALAAVFVVVLFWDHSALLGVPRALKPAKFAVSIAVFLATVAVLLPTLELSPGARETVAWLLLVTMVLEMIPIGVQPFRGQLSHFNLTGGMNTALWRLMMGAIVVTTFTMLFVAVVATFYPLAGPGDLPMAPLQAMSWRIALWFFPLVAFSGFAMGGRNAHSVGGVDGGAGLPLVNWSVTHGDLRVSHFFSMHALQFLPLVAAALSAMPLGDRTRWMVFIAAVAIQAFLSLGTLVQAFAGRPIW